jgi:hypothetical protein
MRPIEIMYTPQSPDKDADVLSIYIDGVGSSQKRPGPFITAVLLEDSDELTIKLPADRRYSKKNILRAIHNHPRYFRHHGLVRIIGLSKGALLGHDLIEYSRARRRENLFDLVVIDSPTGLIDLKDERAKYLKYVPPIPIRPIAFDQWLGKTIISDGSTPPHEDGLDDEYLKLLNEHEALSKSIRFSGWLRHMKYLIKHQGPRSSVLKGVNMVVIESLTDPLVKQPQAHCKWREMADHTVEVIFVHTPGHGMLMEFPVAYADALRQARVYLEAAAAWRLAA